jgi:hypothetical protein
LYITIIKAFQNLSDFPVDVITWFLDFQLLTNMAMGSQLQYFYSLLRRQYGFHQNSSENITLVQPFQEILQGQNVYAVKMIRSFDHVNTNQSP